MAPAVSTHAPQPLASTSAPEQAASSWRAAALGRRMWASVQWSARWQAAHAPLIAASVCWAISFLDLSVLVSPGLRALIARSLGVLPGVAANTAVLATAAAGVLLWWIAGGLRRRQRGAWHVAVLLLAASLSARIWAAEHVHTFAAAPIVVNALLLLYLVLHHGQFQARSEPIPRTRAAALFAAMVTGCTVIGLAIVSLRSSQVRLPEPMLQRLGDVWLGWVGIDNALDSGPGRTADAVYYTLLGLGLAMGALALFLLLRTPRVDASELAADRADLRALMLIAQQPDSLDYFALRHDKALAWSPSRRSAIAYGVEHGVMLASGDPLGDPDDWSEAIAASLTTAREHAWTIGVAACSARGRDAWQRAAGLAAFEIGDEAVLDAAQFALTGNAKKNLRRQLNRAERSGAKVRVEAIGDLEPAQRSRLAACSAAWRHGRVERGFSMALGRACDGQDPEALMAWADLDGAPVALLQFVPWGLDGWSLDLMRRSHTAPAGIMDTLIVAAIAHARAHERTALSLNFAPFRTAIEGEPTASAPRARAWRRTLLFASKWAQIESMYRFNAKYRPTWVPRYLLFPGTREFARVSTAYLRAEGFITRTGWLR